MWNAQLLLVGLDDSLAEHLCGCESVKVLQVLYWMGVAPERLGRLDSWMRGRGRRLHQAEDFGDDFV